MPCNRCGKPKLDCNCPKEFTRMEFYKLLDAVEVYHNLLVKDLPDCFRGITHHAAFYYNRRQLVAGRKVKMHRVEDGWLFVRTA